MPNQEIKVVSIRPDHERASLHPRLEEIRQILRESDVTPAHDELSDEVVVRDEVKFRRRFGRRFDFGPRHREALIELKQKWDLTDREIRLFWQTGNLRKTAHGVNLTASPWAAAAGSMQLLYLVPLFSAAILAGWENLLFAPLRYVQVWLMLFGVAVYGFALYWSQIKPWLIQRRLRS